MDKKIENLGMLSKKILLFGGVYSNLQALEKLIAIATANGISPQNCICTGDIVGYCAQPEETVQLFRAWGAKSIVGNVELQLKAGATDCGCDFGEGSRCDGFSRLWYPFAQSRLSEDSLNYINTLPDHIQFQFASKKVAVLHGSFFNVSEFIFKSNSWSTKLANFEAIKSDVIVAGHCGLPFNEEKESKLWLNPGAIGMPANDGTPRAWYAVLTDDNGVFGFAHHHFEYDHELAVENMKTHQLPEEYALSLQTGVWDNTEILPPAESNLQGIKINF